MGSSGKVEARWMDWKPYLPTILVIRQHFVWSSATQFATNCASTTSWQYVISDSQGCV